MDSKKSINFHVVKRLDNDSTGKATNKQRRTGNYTHYRVAHVRLNNLVSRVLELMPEVKHKQEASLGCDRH